MVKVLTVYSLNTFSVAAKLSKQNPPVRWHVVCLYIKYELEVGYAKGDPKPKAKVISAKLTDQFAPDARGVGRFYFCEP